MWYEQELDRFYAFMGQLAPETHRYLFNTIGYKRALPHDEQGRPNSFYNFAHRIGKRFSAHQTNGSDLILFRHGAPSAIIPVFVVNTTAETPVVTDLTNYATAAVFDHHIPRAWRTFFRLSVIATPTARSITHLEELVERVVQQDPTSGRPLGPREELVDEPGVPEKGWGCQIECLRLSRCESALDVFGLLWVTRSVLKKVKVLYVRRVGRVLDDVKVSLEPVSIPSFLNLDLAKEPMPRKALELDLSGITELHIDAELAPGMDFLAVRMENVRRLSVYVGQRCGQVNMNYARILAMRFSSLKSLTVFVNNYHAEDHVLETTMPKEGLRPYDSLQFYFLCGTCDTACWRIRLFCHAELKNLSVYTPYKFAGFKQIVETVADCCPELKSLKFDVSHPLTSLHFYANS